MLSLALTLDSRAPSPRRMRRVGSPRDLISVWHRDISSSCSSLRLAFLRCYFRDALTCPGLNGTDSLNSLLRRSLAPRLHLQAGGFWWTLLTLTLPRLGEPAAPQEPISSRLR